MRECSDRDIIEISGSRNYGWAELPSLGASGGILILWNLGTIDAGYALDGAFTLTILNNIIHSHPNLHNLVRHLITSPYFLIQTTRHGAPPFRFEIMWFEAPGFSEKLKEWWESIQASGSPSMIL
ncbi:hypothetical protein BVC80_7529g5 [Macleaya cordata]|uniref:Uncharacterized protein n=1 Tax=Macleaya cordata TaxID=56857 RepID=A0A200R8P0_MACCD|nr:hypothetical protein BVC80_7529g5 [Macleaya cordata]